MRDPNPQLQLNTRPASARVSDVWGAGNRVILYGSTLVFSRELEGISQSMPQRLHGVLVGQ